MAKVERSPVKYAGETGEQVMENGINQSVLSVAQLLKLDTLKIPEYQRPYKWTQDNVFALFQDIHVQMDKSAIV